MSSTPRNDGTALLYIDRHLVHEVTSPQAFEGLRLAGRKVWRVSSIVATADHNTPTTGWDAATTASATRSRKLQVDTLDANIKAFGAAAYFPFLRQAPGHRPRHRAGAGRHAAGHDRRLRRLATPARTAPSARWRTASAPARSSTCWPRRRCWPRRPKNMLVKVDGTAAARRDRQGHRAGHHRHDRHRRRHRLRHRVRRRGHPRAVRWKGA